jgi:hypothetical protein
VAVTQTDARRALLERLIDHAPTFPPAELALPDALADHDAARSSDAAWLVNRFVVRASALPFLPRSTPPRLSVVIDVPWEERALDDPRIEAIELPLPAELAALAGMAHEVYVEVTPDADLAPLAANGLRAKVRCGGVRVPTTGELAAFLRECRRLELPFKATAGLHHAVYARGAHGFLNLLAAAVFGDELRSLADADPGSFALTPEEFSWRDRTASADHVTAVRRGLLVGFGSCSFTEPVDELRAIGIL